MQTVTVDAKLKTIKINSAFFKYSIKKLNAELIFSSTKCTTEKSIECCDFETFGY